MWERGSCGEMGEMEEGETGRDVYYEGRIYFQ